MSNGNGSYDYADKIAKLLRKAESAATEEEANSFFEKAQELMVRYAISEQELADARGEQVQDEIVRDEYHFTGIYQTSLFFLGQFVAEVNDLKVLISKRSKTSQRPSSTVCVLVGFSRDIATVKQLIQSLEIQVLQEQSRWWKSEGAERMSDPYYSKMDKFKAKRTFIDGFVHKVHARLAAAKKQSIATVDAERQVEDSTSSSVALVLRSRKEQVEDWYDTKYGRTTRTSRVGGYQMGGAGSYGAGQAAGSRADIGLTKVRGGGSRKQLGS